MPFWSGGKTQNTGTPPKKKKEIKEKTDEPQRMVRKYQRKMARILRLQRNGVPEIVRYSAAEKKSPS